MRIDILGRRTSDTWDTIYPASGPQRENPTCCLSDLVLMMMYRSVVRALVERDYSSPMLGGLGDVYRGAPASLYIYSQVGVYMSPSRLQVGVLVLRLKSLSLRLNLSCRCPRVGLWWAANQDTHQVPSRRGVMG